MSNTTALRPVPAQGSYCLRPGTIALERLSLPAAILLATCLACSPAHADGGYLSMGVGGGQEDVWSWQSVSWAPFTGIDETGVLLRAAIRTETKTYKTELPGRTNVRIWAQGVGADAEVGWQWVDDWGRIAAWAGVAWRDYMLSPSDPNSKLAANDLGAKLTLDGQYMISQSWGVFGYGEYLAGFDEWFVQAIPYYQLDNGLKLGPEMSLSGGDDYLHARAGLFVTGYELDLPWVGQFWIGGSAGALIHTDDGDIYPYAGLHLSRRISGF